MRQSRWCVSAVVFLMLSTLPTMAQPPRGHDTSGAIQFRLGGFFPQGGGEFWKENEEVFTLDIGDFRSTIFGITFMMPVSNHVEVGFNADFYNETVVSAYRGFVDQAGFPILHDTMLRQIPLVADIRLLPGGRHGVRGSRSQFRVRHPVFYLGGGIGVNYWEYEEIGDFLDFGLDPPVIFFDRFIDDGFAFSAHAVAGIELPVGPNWGLLFEGRYTWSDDELDGDFAGLGSLDLDGASALVGASIHF